MQASPQNNRADSYRYEALFNHASMGIVVASSKGLIESVNPFALSLFGYTIEEIAGKPIEVLIPLRYHHKHVLHRNAYSQNPKSRPMGTGFDLFGAKKDGTEFPVEVSLGNYQNGGDENIIAFINDITVRKKAEAQIEKLNTELETTIEKRTIDLKHTLKQLEISNTKQEDLHAFQKAILDNAGAMIIATDEKGIIKLFNPEASLNIGYSQEEAINKMSPVAFHQKSEIMVKRKELFNTFGITVKDDFAVLVEKSRRNIHEEEQYTYIRKDSTSFPVILTITAIRNGNGEVTGFMGIAIDISERNKAEQDLRESLKKEKELSELKSRFVSMASHEFRTPLSTILSSAYLIEKYTLTDDQPKREKHLQRIYSSVNMLTDILNDFLSVGKIEEGKIQVRLNQFNIQELIMSITGEIKNTLKKQQKIIYQHQGKTETVLDMSLLKHIIMNLVSNASKFSSEGSSIEITTACQNNLTILSVKDHGIGIPQEDQKHLMERFFRGANAGNIQGTGLGLHIVAKYAELMNGKVTCKSELEKGTEFIISFTTKKD